MSSDAPTPVRESRSQARPAATLFLIAIFWTIRAALFGIPAGIVVTCVFSNWASPFDFIISGSLLGALVGGAVGAAVGAFDGLWEVRKTVGAWLLAGCILYASAFVLISLHDLMNQGK